MLSDVFNEILSYVTSAHFLAVFFICITVSFFALFIGMKKTDGGKNEFDSGFRKSLLPASALIIASLILSLLLMIPVTALIFRKFQTVFFTYRTLWVMIPAVPLSAFVLTLSCEKLKSFGKKIFIPAVILGLFVILSCGRFGSSLPKVKGAELPGLKEEEITFKEAAPVLEKLSSLPDDSIVLTTPALTEYLRQYTGSIKTLYGRDIWDGSLAAYNYNTYSDEVKELYDWMLYSDSYGCIYYNSGYSILKDFDYSSLDHAALDADPHYLGGTSFAQRAKELGACAICFSVNEKTDREGLEYLKAALSAESEYIEVDSSYDIGYYILYI